MRARTRAAVDRAGYAKPAGDTVVKSEKHTFKLETVAEGVTLPWGLAFLPDGRMLVTEKVGQLRMLQNGTLSEPISGVPAVWSQGQGGLLDVAPHPDYASNGWIYLSFSDPGEGGSAMTKVVRGKLRDGAFVDQQVLFEAPAATYRTGNVHFGSRFVFDNGYLFFSIGERGQMQDAQDLSRPNGKVHRIHDDGRVPTDNPFVGQQNAMPTIWSYGHRNPQGLAKHPVTGALYDAEHGPRGGDELNLVEKAQELRLAGHHLRHELQRHADDRQDRDGRHGTARDLLGAVDCGVVDQLLHGRQVPPVEERSVRRRAGATGTASSRDA